MLENDLQVKTNQFDGPLSLLLYLAEKQEMDLQELDISVITQQYLSYIQKMEKLDFDSAGDYLFMAATLIYLKSESCLGGAESPLVLGVEDGALIKITSRSELITRLQELRHFQNLGQKLWSRPKLHDEIFIHPSVDRKALINTLLLPMELNQLTMAMVDIIKREKRKFTTLAKENFSVKHKILSLKGMLEVGKVISFAELLRKSQEECESLKKVVTPIENCVVTFIALLELARLKKIRVLQHDQENDQEEMRDIYIEVVESIADVDLDTIENFETLQRPSNVVTQ